MDHSYSTDDSVSASSTDHSCTVSGDQEDGRDHSYSTARDKHQVKDHSYFSIGKKTPLVVQRKAQRVLHEPATHKWKDHTYTKCQNWASENCDEGAADDVGFATTVQREPLQVTNTNTALRDPVSERLAAFPEDIRKDHTYSDQKCK